MSIIALVLVLLAAAALVLLVVRLAITVRADGYGHRPPPLSHASWSAPPQ